MKIANRDMANASPQLIVTSWLDDQNGPAKLTARQIQLSASLEDPNQRENSTAPNCLLSSADNIIGGNEDECNDPVGRNSLKDLLLPKWKPNKIITMFRDERDKLIVRGQDYARLLASTKTVLDDILSLKELYLFISSRSSQLHLECKSIIKERNDLKESYERINLALSRKEELRSIFRRIPEIKNQVLSILNLVYQDYQKRQQPDGTPLDEYYGRFFIECRRIKELTNQLESCLISSSTDELLLHLEEIYTIYFDIREQLISPVFTKSIRNLVLKAERNYCDLLRQSCASLVRILRNEIQLFNQIFPSPLPSIHASSPLSTSSKSTSVEQIAEVDKDDKALRVIGKDHNPVKRQAIKGYLELLCKIFYEHLRPVIIHVNHLETLAELYKLVTETMRTEVMDESYEGTMSALAEDIQERMVFRTEVFIQESVLDYKPSRGDLAYPEKLEIVIGGELKDFQSMWYPTVQRSVLALFYLNRVFDPLTFQELAQEVVVACLKSLDLAQRLIDERHGGTKIEATLFLSKHLAIIKDQMRSYSMPSLFSESSIGASSELFKNALKCMQDDD